ncbi:MAG TPA: S8 family serine peptidase, partial [bacterium]|nr:S8 family serine peptidase [bacterium]
MTSRLLSSLAIVAIVAAALPAPAGALEIAEVHGDFYYDRDGALVGHRNAELPDPENRRPMSHKEKFAAMGLQLPPANLRVSLKPRALPDKPVEVQVHAGVNPEIVIVKFHDDDPVRLRNGRLSSSGPAAATAETVLAGYPTARLERAIRTEERILDEDRQTGQLLSGAELADLNNYYVVTFPAGSGDGVRLANELLALDEVETAYLEAKASDPSCSDILPVTGAWDDLQNYLDPAPAGLDADYAWAYHAGGNGYGSGYWIIDCERTWTFDHEDLNFAATDVVNGVTGSWYSDHGTSVVGIYGACDNGYGTSGISPDVRLKAMDHNSEPTLAAGVTVAASFLLSGEIMVLETQIGGPPSGGVCPCNCPDFDVVPIEWDPMVFAAIQTATANGIIVVEAGANGSANLDNTALYGNAFQRWFQDSGAILVGAADNTHAPSCFTSTGSRVDVHGYGGSVYSTGYGDLWSGSASNRQQDYTQTFNGTSSATPMIVGAAAAVQGIAKAKYGITLTPSQMRGSLKRDGTPQNGGANIGPMPNLVTAINEVEPDLRPYTPSGWDYPVVPRSVTGTTGGSCPLGAGALPGGGTTYWNAAEENNPFAYAPTVNMSDFRIYVDDIWDAVGFGGNLSPGGWQYIADLASTNVKGGRHSIHLESDWEDVEEEWIETNNVFSRQFIWSGLALAEDVPVTRSYDPVATDARWPGPFYNAEGVQATPSTGYWHVFAVMPTGVSDDFDIRLNTEAPANVPQAGFGTSVRGSFTGAGEIAWVGWDRNTVSNGLGTHYASVLNFAGTSNKIVEFESDDGVYGVGTHGPFTIQSGDLVDVHELSLTAGNEVRVHIEVLSGAADFGISLLDGTSGYHDKVGTVMPGGYADNAGPSQDEFVIVVPTVTDYHGLVVWKKTAADAYSTLTYNLHVSLDPNLVGDGLASGWDYPIVPRNSTDASTFFVDLPTTLNGNQPTTSFNWSTYNQGANAATGPWDTQLRLDDVLQFTGTAATLSSGAYFVDMNNPQVQVAGGRHYVRSTADALSQVTEFDETDNTFVDWFAWSPMDVSTVAGTRPAPGIATPLGYTWYACDGYRTIGGVPASFWTTVGIIPTDSADDYDVRAHVASTGSKNGFDNPLASSFSGPGLTDFVIINHNNLGDLDYDYGVLNLSGGVKGFEIRENRAPYHGTVPAGVTRYGPFTMNTPEPIEMHEFHIDASLVGIPVYISLNQLTGTPDLVLAVFDGAIDTHDRSSAMATVNAAPGGQDEHLGPVFFPAVNFYAVAVYKNGTADINKGGQYELVFSSGSSAVDAPETAAVPLEFALAAPSPNPFRGNATTVKFDLPAPTDVRVSVYDLAGRRVATLTEGTQPAGRHSIRWDGRDVAGRRVGAG